MVNADPYDATGTYDFPDERGDARLLGVSTRGEPVYYDPVAHVKLVGDADYDDHVPDWTSETELAPDTDVADLVAEVEDAVGWDALTAFADEHLGDDGTGSTADDTS